MSLLLLLGGAEETITPPPTSGAAWIGVTLNILDAGVSTNVGAVNIGIAFSDSGSGVSPDEITEIQPQGVSALVMRSGVDSLGRPLPVITLPPQSQLGKAQLSFQLAPTVGDQQLPAEMMIRVSFEAGQETLGVEFPLSHSDDVIVTVPRVLDWPTIRATNHTDETGDPEFFALDALNPDQVIPFSWAALGELTWEDIPDELTWADAETLWAE